MARIHVLEGSSTNVHRVVVHDAAPVGNNVVGVPWADAIKNSGLAVTSMINGNGPGQITTNEKNQIEAGTLIEGTFPWEDNPAWTPTERDADLDLRANQLIAELQDTLQDRLRLFGKTRG